MLVLGIETSCDECSAALVKDGRELLSNVVSSQIDLHRDYGGVVPEIAARAHVESIVPVVEDALQAADSLPELISVTVGPGLVGSLLVGVAAAKALSWSWKVPFVGVNHLEAHAFAPLLEGELPEFPFLALVVSGGHTLIAEIRDFCDMTILGETQDDALGEAFDKVSKYLGLGYPGGPIIEEISRSGDSSAVNLPRPMAGSGDYNFSYSGLKTAVIRAVMKARDDGAEYATEDIAASFQVAALEVIVKKTVGAAIEYGHDSIVIGGGVACNSLLRELLEAECAGKGIELVTTPPVLCTDNGAMVAALGYFHFRRGCTTGLETDVYPNLRLGSPVP
ncbi:MAG: tRNA (adenosine(37)-N6)-threonylcarbamoyltransferase complex transferase subunit TsaD [Actinobacteria bacterium]|nr:tRNA (adenosine(37)-N6)-threonylcarbamoyltransferase complex transferase subunit TsaD [Actinomycetota bacterium]